MDLSGFKDGLVPLYMVEPLITSIYGSTPHPFYRDEVIYLLGTSFRHMLGFERKCETNVRFLRSAVEGVLFANLQKVPVMYRLPLLRFIYRDREETPSAECWEQLLFPYRICNDFDNDDGHRPNPADNEDIVDTPFCLPCYLRCGPQSHYALSPTPCSCQDKYHFEILHWLIQKGVKPLSSFWYQVAFKNLYHLAHFVYTMSPPDLRISSADSYGFMMLKTATEFECLEIAKFLAQYGWVTNKDIEEVGAVFTYSYEMETILRTRKRCRTLNSEIREEISVLQSLVDNHKESLPTGFYVDICGKFKAFYNSLK